MQVIVLVAFVVTLTSLQSLADLDALAAGPHVAPGILAYLLTAAGLSWLNSTISLRAMRSGEDLPPRSARRHGLLASLTHLWLLAGLAGVILTGYGRWLTDDLGLHRIALVCELAGVAPFVAALLLAWAFEYPFHRAMRVHVAAHYPPGSCPVWTPREFLGYNVRHHLLFIGAPVCLIVLSTDLLRTYLAPVLGPPLLSETLGGILLFAAMLTATALVFFFAPVLVVHIWKTRPLPAGPLRGELEEACRRMRLRYRDILVWQSGGVIANAGVMGLAAPVRYILLSDALLENMDRGQVMAIFAHEAGHIVQHHIFYSMLLAVASATLCVTAGDILARATGAPVRGELFALPVLAIVWGLGFGWVSRRFEWQSDAISAWAVGTDPPRPDGTITPEGAAVFARALERVAQLNGIPYRQRNWRHGSIRRRVETILWLGGTGGSRKGIDKLVRRIKVGLWIAALAAAAGTGLLAYWV